MTVTVKVENFYACGRESTSIEDVRDPVPGERIEDWWGDVVHPVTGDDHDCGSSEHALYEVTVVEAHDPELLAGDTYSWEG